MAVERGFKIATAFVEITADYDNLRRSVREELPRRIEGDADVAGRRVGRKFGQSVGKGAGPEAEKSGRDSGGKLARGMNLAIVRNSPLIAAAVAGALALGAPAALAAVTGIFAAVGTVAAAQSVKVQRAWSATWAHISQGAQQDAAVLVPTLVNAASKISAGFDSIRPALRDAFEASAPLIDRLVDSLVGAAQNAMPGFVRALQSAGPAIDGLGSLIESIGTGLSDFFSIVSEHSDAAGEVFRALGDIIEALLPILGRLFGTGAEIASVMLPALAKALDVVGDVLKFIEPILPAVVTGFLALKAAQVAAGWLGTFSGALTKLSQNLAFASYGSGAFAGSAGRLSGAVSGASKVVSGLGSALPVIGIVAGAVAMHFAEIDQNAREMADGLRAGGDQAEAARAKLQGLGDSWGGASRALAESSIPDWIVNAGSIFGGLSSSMFTAAATSRETTDALHEQWLAMSPLEQAQSKVSEWTATLTQRMRDLGPAAENTQIAHERLAYWQEKAADAARAEEEAVHGSAIAMQDAVDAADALMDALDKMNNPTLTLRDAQRGFQEALDAASEALRENGRTLDIGSEKGRANQETLDNIAESAMKVAQSIYETTGNYGQFRSSLEQARGQLYDQARAFGMSEQAASDYVNEVLGIPSEWRTTAEFDTSTAQGEVDALMSYLKQQEPGATINVGVISEQAYNTLADLGLAVHALPDGTVEVTLDDKSTPVINGYVLPALDNVGRQHPTPTVGLNTGPFSSFIARGLGQMANFASQRPTPVANMNANPFAGVHASAMSKVASLASQRPTPTANMIDSPFLGVYSKLVSIIGKLNGMNARPTATMVASTSSAEAALNYAARSRTSYVYQVAVSAGATGGKIANGVIGFDSGGKVRGAGGPTDDLVGVLGPRSDLDYRLSNLEWIIRASSAVRYGDAKMRSVNNGTATILTPTEARFAGGGSPGSAGTGMAGLTIGALHIHLDGTFDFTSSRGLRSVAEAIRDELVDIERSYR